jgi:flagellar biosynthetic protein FliR
MQPSATNVLHAALALEPDALVQLGVASLLLAARLVPLILLAPWLLATLAPRVVQLSLLALLVVSMLPACAGVLGTLPTAALPLIGLCARELLIGLVLGVGLALPVLALRWAGEVIESVVRELGGDHLPQSDDAPIARLYGWLAAALFVAVGGHRVALHGLARSFDAAPLGTLAALGDPLSLALGSARLLQAALEAAALVALPVIAVLLLAEVLLALVGRLASAPLVPALGPVARPLVLLTVLWMGLMALTATLPVWFSKALASVLALWSAP